MLVAMLEPQLFDVGALEPDFHALRSLEPQLFGIRALEPGFHALSYTGALTVWCWSPGAWLSRS